LATGFCFHTSDDVYRVVGPPMISDWVQFHAETGGFDVKIETDEALSVRSGDPKIFIYQVQGPMALNLVSDASGGTLPDIRFFHIGEFSIQGCAVRALRHGMAGAPGFEIFGPWKDHQKILSALEKRRKIPITQGGRTRLPHDNLRIGLDAAPLPGHLSQ